MADSRDTLALLMAAVLSEPLRQRLAVTGNKDAEPPSKRRKLAHEPLGLGAGEVLRRLVRNVHRVHVEMKPESAKWTGLARRLQRWWRAVRQFIPRHNGEDGPAAEGYVRYRRAAVACPISLDRIPVTDCIKVVSPAQGNVIAYDKAALAGYLAARQNFVCPLTREPFNRAQVRYIGKRAADARLLMRFDLVASAESLVSSDEDMFPRRRGGMPPLMRRFAGNALDVLRGRGRSEPADPQLMAGLEAIASELMDRAIARAENAGPGETMTSLVGVISDEFLGEWRSIVHEIRRRDSVTAEALLGAEDSRLLSMSRSTENLDPNGPTAGVFNWLRLQVGAELRIHDAFGPLWWASWDSSPADTPPPPPPPPPGDGGPREPGYLGRLFGLEATEGRPSEEDTIEAMLESASHVFRRMNEQVPLMESRPPIPLLVPPARPVIRVRQTRRPTRRSPLLIPRRSFPAPGDSRSAS